MHPASLLRAHRHSPVRTCVSGLMAVAQPAVSASVDTGVLPSLSATLTLPPSSLRYASLTPSPCLRMDTHRGTVASQRCASMVRSAELRRSAAACRRLDSVANTDRSSSCKAGMSSPRMICVSIDRHKSHPTHVGGWPVSSQATAHGLAWQARGPLLLASGEACAPWRSRDPS